jgi:hypothetical protein
VDSQVHDWFVTEVYKLGGFLGSVGHRVKIHKFTPVTGKAIRVLDDQIYTPLDNFRTQSVQMVVLNLMVLLAVMTYTTARVLHVQMCSEFTAHLHVQ